MSKQMYTYFMHVKKVLHTKKHKNIKFTLLIVDVWFRKDFKTTITEIK